MPLWHLYFNKISLYLQSIIVAHPIHSDYNFGTKCPELISPNMALSGISPVAAYRSEQPGAVFQGCISTAVYRRRALDWRPRLFYFPAV